MNASILATCLLIVIARIADVSLGTVRTVCVVRGHRGVAWFLGLFEILIWIFAVSKVIQNLQHPAYAIAYALGFATGNYIGMTIERWLAFGEQVVRVFTRRGSELAAGLREAGFGVTQFNGEGRDGPVQLLFLETPRKQARNAIAQARRLDPDCFYVVDDIAYVSRATAARQASWRTAMKRK